LRQEHRLKVVEYRVLRNVSAPEMVEETGDWKIFHIEMHRDLHF
jgi:hypothetical protein